MLYITKHARERLAERYQIEPNDINREELFKLCEEHHRYGIYRYNDTYAFSFFYNNQLLKVVYNPKEKVLVTVNPLKDYGRGKLDNHKIAKR